MGVTLHVLVGGEQPASSLFLYWRRGRGGYLKNFGKTEGPPKKRSSPWWSMGLGGLLDVPAQRAFSNRRSASAAAVTVSWCNNVVLVLRCTARLLARMKIKPGASPPASTTGLGDIYANLVRVRHQQLVLAVSERTLLPVVIPAAPAATIAARVRVGTIEVLRALDVPEQRLREEDIAMGAIAVGKTMNRSTVGAMVEFAKALEYTWESHATLLEASRSLASMVCMPLRPDPFPDRVTRKLFEGR